nr:glycosyltransferase family 2 protein [Paracidobacterium acidisoli]
MIWDNSQEAIPADQLPPSLLYRHSEKNLGVSGAYNSSAHYAHEHGYPWMMLLDQDTCIPMDFLQKMAQHCEALLNRLEIAAVAPVVFVRKFLVSPRQQLFNRHRAYPFGEIGIAPGEAFAINSGCVLRVTALQQVGGYSTDFWLDYSDLYLFHQFFLYGLKVWRAADATLEHDMSIMDYDRLMSPSRYRNFSYAESAFNDLYKGRMENAVQTLRVFVRALKQRKKYKNPEFSRIAWEQWMYRMRVPRKERIRRWIEAGKLRMISQSNPEDQREKISS